MVHSVPACSSGRSINQPLYSYIMCSYRPLVLPEPCKLSISKVRICLLLYHLLIAMVSDYVCFSTDYSEGSLSRCCWQKKCRANHTTASKSVRLTNTSCLFSYESVCCCFFQSEMAIDKHFPFRAYICGQESRCQSGRS